MAYQQKFIINTTIIKPQLANLLNLDIKEVKSEFQPTGYSGNVHKLEIVDSDRKIHPLIIKKVPDLKEYDFYQEVLKHLQLNSPQMFGTLNSDEDLLIVMEYIPHLLIDWGDKTRFEKAVEWLIKKDKLCQENLSQLSTITTIQPQVWDGTERWLKKISLAVKHKVHADFNKEFLNKLESSRDKLHKSVSVLNSQTKTINHNDFHMNNILFGTEKYQNQIFIIDWSGPNFGSVCVDLANLYSVTPLKFQPFILDYYRQSVDFPEFDEEFRAGKVRTYLSTLAWMAEAFIDGQGDVVNYDRLKLFIAQLQELLN